MASAGIPSGPTAFPFLSVMMAFLISAFVGFSQLMGNSISAGGMSGNAVQQLSEVLYPSLQLFLYCRQWFSVFVLYWHVSQRELACQLLGCQILVPVVRKVDNAIHRINLYPVDSVVCFVNTYPLDSDLSGGYVIQPLNNRGQVFKITLTGCFLLLTGQVIDVVPFVFPDAPLHFPMCYCVFSLCL